MNGPCVRLGSLFRNFRPEIKGGWSMRRSLVLGTRTACAVVALALVTFAQSDRGTITGTVTDPAGAVVPSAPITVKNRETGAVYEGATPATGSYMIAQVTGGVYE